MSKPRISLAFLDAQIDRINKLTNSPPEPYVRGGNKFVAQIGCHYISRQYGGYALVRITNDAGAETNVLGCGHVSARELSERMVAYVRGLMDGKELS